MRDVGTLADLVGGTVDGDRSLPIRGLAPLESAGPDELSFLSRPRYRELAARTHAGAVIAPRGTTLPAHVAAILHEDPYAAFAILMNLFHPSPDVEPGIHQAAWVSPAADLDASVAVGPGAAVLDGAQLGARVAIGANAVVGEGVRIGEGTRVAAGAVLVAGSVIGARCRIGPGAVVGSAGFGYAPDGDGWMSIPQVGIVVLEDEVEIGAHVTIDRATLGETRIGHGSKFDNQVQIGHNVLVGAGTVIVAQSGVAGSTRLGRGVQIGGQVGLVGHLSIGDAVRIGAGSGVHGDIPDDAIRSGAPAFDHAGWRRSVSAFPRLPALLKRVRALECELEELKLLLRGDG